MIDELLDRNREFMKGSVVDARKLLEQRESTRNSQSPHTLVVSCSDSRVVPEYIFKAGIGELFVVRTAGQRMCSAALGSVDYGVSHLKVRQLIVLGHQGCGAVKAAWEGASVAGHLGELIDQIRPVVDKCKEEGKGFEEAVEENVRDVISSIRKELNSVRDAEKRGELAVYGAIYSLATGEVRLIE